MRKSGPHRIYPPSPRNDWKEMVCALTTHVGEKVRMGGGTGRLVHYGCPTCSINFAVVYADGATVIHPGDVHSIGVVSVEDHTITKIVMKQYI